MYIGFGILKFKYHKKVKFKNSNSLIQRPVKMKKVILSHRFIVSAFPWQVIPLALIRIESDYRLS